MSPSTSGRFLHLQWSWYSVVFLLFFAVKFLKLWEQSLEAMPVFITVPVNGFSGVWRCTRVSVYVCIGWGKWGWKMVKPLTSSHLHHLHGLGPCCLSDAGDGGQAVRWLLEFLRLCGGGLRDGAKTEWQSDTTGANVSWAQRWILPSIAFHYAGCVGCKAFTCPVTKQDNTASGCWL